MNAYELTKDRADILADELLAYHHKGVCGRAAKMLRQQADRIAELEETINACYTVQKMQAEEVYKGNDRIAELEKKLQESAMNYISICSQADEHYARVQELEKDGKVCATCGGLVYDPVLKQTKQSEPVAWMQMHYKNNVPTKFSPVKVWEDDIPLYTTPQTKPLSDEEIEYYEHLIAKLFNVSIQQKVIGLDRIIRAIEERHGIK